MPAMTAEEATRIALLSQSWCCSFVTGIEGVYKRKVCTYALIQDSWVFNGVCRADRWRLSKSSSKQFQNFVEYEVASFLFSSLSYAFDVSRTRPSRRLADGERPDSGAEPRRVLRYSWQEMPCIYNLRQKHLSLPSTSFQRYYRSGLTRGS
jgi:hypothetical protein